LTSLNIKPRDSQHCLWPRRVEWPKQ